MDWIHENNFFFLTFRWPCIVTACEQDQHRTSWSCSQAVSKPVWHIPLLCVQWKTLDDGQRNCPKHVEFFISVFNQLDAQNLFHNNFVHQVKYWDKYTEMHGQQNVKKIVEFYSKNKFEKLVHRVGFIIRTRNLIFTFRIKFISVVFLKVYLFGWT